MTSFLVKTAMAGAFALPVIVGLSAPAQAETNPYCSSGVTQIGTTAYVTSGGQTFASVKQFKGCNKNWSYLYVWQGWRDTHSSWDACTSVTTRSGSTTTIQDVRCNSGRFSELWSQGASTLSLCTRALGWKGYGPWPDSDDPKASTSERC